MDHQIIQIYTDGSCHTQLKIGTWAAILFIDSKKIVLEGNENETSHNRMELTAILRSIEYLIKENLQQNKIHVFSDSQYAVNLQARKERLEKKEFTTKKGLDIRNKDLVTSLLSHTETLDITYTKVKAHQKDGDEYNREVDLLVRNNLRKIVQHGQH